MRTSTLLALSLTALGLIGCAPADVAGTYTVALSNGPNDCAFDGWDASGEATGVGVTVTQDEENVSLDVTGLIESLFLNGILGSDTFTGTVSGNHVSATILGTVNRTDSGCSAGYRLIANLEADLRGDVLEGDIEYAPQTYECFEEGCGNMQLFSGVRPPTE
jgi:hypothetical protein